MQIGLNLTLRAINASARFSPASLFAAGEQGAWYDPSDLSTLFQDAAGTTPVTAVEQSVGLMRDKSGRGNHAFQSTGTSRTVLSARVNLLTKTEQFDDAAWVKTNVTVSANATVAPDGTQTADVLFEQAIDGLHRVTEDIATIVGVSYKVSAYLKPNGRTWAVVVAGTAGNGYYFDLQNLTVGSETGGAGTVSNPSITADRNGFVLVSFNVVSTNATRGGIDIFTATGNGQVSFAGDATKGLYVWGADFRVTNTGTNLPVYQRVTTATNYDTAGFPLYLLTDGVDDWYETNSINFTATDKMTVVAGVRKLSDAAAGLVAELSSGIDTNNGAFSLVAASSAGANSYRFGSKGTIVASAGTGVFAAAPDTSVLTAAGDIAGDRATIRRNGLLVETSTADQGTGNYGNYPLFLFRRGGTTLPAQLRFYGLILRGAASTPQQIAQAEAWMNQRIRAY